MFEKFSIVWLSINDIDFIRIPHGIIPQLSPLILPLALALLIINVQSHTESLQLVCQRITQVFKLVINCSELAIRITYETKQK